MNEFRIIEIKQSVYADNNAEADRLRTEMKNGKTFLLNLMSSPGSGKTTLLKRTIGDLKNDLKIAVLEADIDSDVDARAVSDAGAEAVQLHTGGMCHLTAGMTRQGTEALDLKNIDLAVIENIGNLICPAEFDTGAAANVMILSVPEGDDKPLKYPNMFSVCDVLLINKIDVKPYFDFDTDLCIERVRKLNPDIRIFALSGKTGEGFLPWIEWLKTSVHEWQTSDTIRKNALMKTRH